MVKKSNGESAITVVRSTGRDQGVDNYVPRTQALCISN